MSTEKMPKGSSIYTFTMHVTQIEAEYIATSIAMYIIKCRRDRNLAAAANKFDLAAEYDLDLSNLDAIVRQNLIPHLDSESQEWLERLLESE